MDVKLAPAQRSQCSQHLRVPEVRGIQGAPSRTECRAYSCRANNHQCRDDERHLPVRLAWQFADQQRPKTSTLTLRAVTWPRRQQKQGLLPLLEMCALPATSRQIRVLMSPPWRPPLRQHWQV